MLSELATRLRRVRIRLSVEPIATMVYSTCPHWWSWWIPNANPVWGFYDDDGVLHSCAVTYGTNPVIVTSLGDISGGIWFGAPPVEIVYGSELDTKIRNADTPTIYITSEHRGRMERLAYPEGTVTAFYIIPQSAKWSAELAASMHSGAMAAIKDVMDRAFVDVLDATWIPLYNADLGKGAGLPGEANSLFMTLRWRQYR